jgi:iron complex transport system ATP-binding protein
MSELLRVEKLDFAYGGVKALSGVDLKLSAGEVIAILGPNGSGKSTLLKLLIGHLPAGGAVWLQDRPLTQWRRREVARLVAYLPQSPTWQGAQTVGNALRLGRAPYWGLLGLESVEDEKTVQAVAERLAVADLLHRRMDELSGGQRQRVLLGRCLVQQPSAMLLDEPDTFLDLKHQMELHRLLRELAVERKLGVLVASHDLNLAAMFADRVIILRQGKIAASGTPDEVLVPSVLEEVYGIAMDRIERPGRPAVLVPRNQST